MELAAPVLQAHLHNVLGTFVHEINFCVMNSLLAALLSPQKISDLGALRLCLWIRSAHPVKHRWEFGEVGLPQRWCQDRLGAGRRGERHRHRPHTAPTRVLGALCLRPSGGRAQVTGSSGELGQW